MILAFTSGMPMARGHPASKTMAHGSVAKFVSLSNNWPILAIEKYDD